MKKIIIFLLASIMCLSLAACASKTVETDTETESSKSATPVAQLKETVSTDIVDFTLEHSKLTYYVSNNLQNLFEPTDESQSPFVAKMGTCFVSMTVTISNKDRAALDFCEPFNNWKAGTWSVTYKGEKYDAIPFNATFDFDDNVDLQYSAIIDKETGKVSQNKYMNVHIDAGETITLRFFVTIKVDPESLNDGFELNVNVPNSKGELEDFKYIVPDIS